MSNQSSGKLICFCLVMFCSWGELLDFHASSYVRNYFILTVFCNILFFFAIFIYRII